MSFLFGRKPSKTFCYVDRNRHDCTTQLVAQAKTFINRESLYEFTYFMG